MSSTCLFILPFTISLNQVTCSIKRRPSLSFFSTNHYCVSPEWQEKWKVLYPQSVSNIFLLQRDLHSPSSWKQAHLCLSHLVPSWSFNSEAKLRDYRSRKNIRTTFQNGRKWDMPSTFVKCTLRWPICFLYPLFRCKHSMVFSESMYLKGQLIERTDQCHNACLPSRRKAHQFEI